MIEMPCRNCGRRHKTSSLWCSVRCQIEAMRGTDQGEVMILSKTKRAAARRQSE